MTAWTAIHALYQVLVDSFPTLGARVAQAGALSAAGRAADAIVVLDAIGDEARLTYQPYWATRTHALRQTMPDDHAQVRDATKRAIDLSTDDATRRFLSRDP